MKRSKGFHEYGRYHFLNNGAWVVRCSGSGIKIWVGGPDDDYWDGEWVLHNIPYPPGVFAHNLIEVTELWIERDCGLVLTAKDGRRYFLTFCKGGGMKPLPWRCGESDVPDRDEREKRALEKRLAGTGVVVF